MLKLIKKLLKIRPKQYRIMVRYKNGEIHQFKTLSDLKEVGPYLKILYLNDAVSGCELIEFKSLGTYVK